MKLFDTGYRKKRISMCGSTRKLNNTPKIVEADNVIELLNGDCCTVVIDGEKYKVLRFLLKIDETLVFAHEGTPSGIVPVHWQMTGVPCSIFATCLAAGNVFFKDNTLHRINNQSGDFRPPFDSLKLVFPKLIEAKIEFSDSLVIEKLGRSGLRINTIEVPMEKIIKKHGAFPPERYEDAHQTPLSQNIGSGDLTPHHNLRFSNL